MNIFPIYTDISSVQGCHDEWCDADHPMSSHIALEWAGQLHSLYEHILNSPVNVNQSQVIDGHNHQRGGADSEVFNILQNSVAYGWFIPQDTANTTDTVVKQIVVSESHVNAGLYWTYDEPIAQIDGYCFYCDRNYESIKAPKLISKIDSGTVGLITLKLFDSAGTLIDTETQSISSTSYVLIDKTFTVPDAASSNGWLTIKIYFKTTSGSGSIHVLPASRWVYELVSDDITFNVGYIYD